MFETISLIFRLNERNGQYHRLNVQEIDEDETRPGLTTKLV